MIPITIPDIGAEEANAARDATPCGGARSLLHRRLWLRPRSRGEELGGDVPGGH